MDIRYYHEFKGQDNILNRFEILTGSLVQAVEVKARADAFSIEYPEVRKLDPVRGSQATMSLISESVFQFVDLHTDDMRGYLVKFYRSGSLYWVGWLDSELYGEELSAVPPYGVTFKASDFNIMERLRYLDASENKYGDIVPLFSHIRRCLDRLGLPFQKLYIGCTTRAEGITWLSTETVLHRLYMMSGNFYDEDGEPMSCREVIEEVLKPFGLMMVQKDANLYIYDYNTVRNGLPLKRFDYATFAFEADETINFSLGNLHDIGFASTDSSYGFEELVNNVTITSSLYASAGGDILSYGIEEDSLDDLKSTSDQPKFTLKAYGKCPPWKGGRFLCYEDKCSSGGTLTGAEMTYTGNGSASNLWEFDGRGCFLIGSDSKVYVRIKVDAYINTRDDPFDLEVTEDDERTRGMALYGDLVLMDNEGSPVSYYCNNPYTEEGWKPVSGGLVPSEKFALVFASVPLTSSRIANAWRTNGQVAHILSSGAFGISRKDQTDGTRVPVPLSSGYMVMRLRYCIVSNPTLDGIDVFPPDRVKNILIDNVSLELEDDKGEKLDTEDYEFKSYVNRKVASDFDDITLKCISANEGKVPIGKGNILRKTAGGFEFQLSYTRAGQTDILERLLMCTVHSNFTTKNEKISVNVKMGGNPALGYVSYDPILSGTYLVVGCTLNFSEAKTLMTAVGYSDDTAKLSGIPYE